MRRKHIDIEPFGEGIPGFAAFGQEGEAGSETWELVLAGRYIRRSDGTEELKFNERMKRGCGLELCTTQVLEDFAFYPVPMVSIFAVDREGGCLGTVWSREEEEKQAVVRIDKNGAWSPTGICFQEFCEWAWNLYGENPETHVEPGSAPKAGTSADPKAGMAAASKTELRIFSSKKEAEEVCDFLTNS